MIAPTHSTPLAPTGAAAEDAGPLTASTLDMVRMREPLLLIIPYHQFDFCQSNLVNRTHSISYCLFNYLSLLALGTNSELSNASESEDVNERDQRPRGVGGEERGSRRGGRGRGTNTGRGRGGPASKPSNSISSGTSMLRFKT